MSEKKTIKWYKRSGQKVSVQSVLKSKRSYADARRTGKMGLLSCAVNLKLANAIDDMTLLEFVNYTGQFTYKIERVKG